MTVALAIYGRTIVTADLFGGETEDPSVILLQWCMHTLQTKPGTLRTAPDHGIDLPGLLLAGLTDAARVAVPAAVEAALERGRRVRSAKATMVETSIGGGKISLALHVEVQPVTGPGISFSYPIGADLADTMNKGA